MSTLAPAEKPTVDAFITLLIAALVVRGKRHIEVRSLLANEERDRMYALYRYIESVRKRESVSEDSEYRRFLVRLRNCLAPSPIGSFDGLLHQFRTKMLTVVSINLPFCEHYDLDLQPVTARSYLDRADPRMRKLAEEAGDAYVAQIARR